MELNIGEYVSHQCKELKILFDIVEAVQLNISKSSNMCWLLHSYT